MSRATNDHGMEPLPDLSAVFAWLDLGARCVEQWGEWQRALWQPALDLQARYVDECLRVLASPTIARGGEQLA